MSAEGVPKLFMHYDDPGTKTTVAVDKGKPLGFFTWNKQGSYAALLHMCVGKDSRRPDVARALIKEFCREVKKVGLKQMLVGVPERNPKMKRLVEYWFKNVSPYALQHKCLFLKAEVS